MDITITMGRQPSAETAPGTAIAKPAPAVAKAAQDAVQASGVQAHEPQPKLTAVADLDNRMELDVDRPTGRVISRLVNWETGKVVDQVPSEEAVRILEKTRRMIGAILDKMA